VSRDFEYTDKDYRKYTALINRLPVCWGWGWSPCLVVAGSLRYAWYDSYATLVIPPFEQSF